MILPTANNITSGSFNEALRKVFLKLLKRKSPIVDDTCLQKLLDMLSIFVLNSESVESCGVVEFLKSIKDNSSAGNATLIFGTQVAGCLAQNEEIFVQFENLFLEFYASIFESPFWQESVSLKTATFHSLKQTIQHSPGFLGIIRHFPDISKETFNAIQEDSSIFLTKKASNLIASLIVQCTCVQTQPDNRQFVLDVQHMLLNKCWDYICAPAPIGLFTNHNPVLESVFLLLCEAENNCKVVLSWLAKQENVLQVLFLIIINATSSELWFQAIDIYLDLLYQECVVVDQEDKMVDVLNKLKEKNEQIKLQTFILKFLKRYSNEELGENLIQLFCQPLSDISKYITGKSHDLPHNPKTKEYQFSSMECKKMVSHTIDCWIEIIATDIMKKDSISTASRSTSSLLLDIICILAAKDKLQMSRHFLLLNALATSNRLLVKILQYFCKLTDCSQEECQLKLDCVVKLLHSSLLIIEDIDQTSSVVSHAFQCIFDYLPVLLSHLPEENFVVTPNCNKDDSNCDVYPQINWSDNSDVLADNVPVMTASVVTCCLCHPKWEIRDTTVEFLEKIFASCAVSPRLLLWVKKHRLHNLVYSSFSDGESYVRATTITAMTSCLQTNDLWSDFLSASKKSLDDILHDFIQVLRTDTEAFPRRAAAKFLLETHKKNLLTSSQKSLIYKTIIDVLDSDLDWEVKIAALSFWENVISTEFDSQTVCPAYAIDLPVFSRNRCQACKVCSLLKKFRALSKLGCIDSLLTAFNDCDHSVCEKAAQVLSKLLFSNEDDEDFVIKLTCLKDKATENEGNLFNCCTGSCCEDDKQESLKDEGFAFLKRLSGVNFRKDLNKCKTGCDLYTQNPLSLIEDILADCEENENEDKIVDCY